MKHLILLLVWMVMGGQYLTAQQIVPVKATELVEKYSKEDGVVVINFWSSWCKPCIEEVPYFIKVYDSLRASGVQLWLVSQDTRDIFNTGKLRNFIEKKEGWNKAKLFWFDETNADYYCPIINKDWSGVIPATLIVNPKKGYNRFIEEAMNAEQLLEEIGKAM